MHSEHKLKAKLQSYAPRVCGIRQHANNTRRRRVSGWVLKKLQKGAWPQKLVKQAKAARACFRRFFAAPTPSAAFANQPCKFLQQATRASQRCKLPQSETLTSQLGKFLKRNMSQPAVQVYFHCGGCIQPRHRGEPVSCDGCFLHPPGVMSEDAEK